MPIRVNLSPDGSSEYFKYIDDGRTPDRPENYTDYTIANAPPDVLARIGQDTTEASPAEVWRGPAAQGPSQRLNPATGNSGYATLAGGAPPQGAQPAQSAQAGPSAFLGSSTPPLPSSGYRAPTAASAPAGGSGLSPRPGLQGEMSRPGPGFQTMPPPNYGNFDPTQGAKYPQGSSQYPAGSQQGFGSFANGRLTSPMTPSAAERGSSQFSPGPAYGPPAASAGYDFSGQTALVNHLASGGQVGPVNAPAAQPANAGQFPTATGQLPQRYDPTAGEKYPNQGAAQAQRQINEMLSASPGSLTYQGASGPVTYKYDPVSGTWKLVR